MLKTLTRWFETYVGIRAARMYEAGYDYAAGAMLREGGPAKRLEDEASGDVEAPWRMSQRDHFNQGMRDAIAKWKDKP